MGVLEAEQESSAPIKLPDTVSPEPNVMLVEDHQLVQRRIRNARARYEGAERTAFDKALWDAVAKHEKEGPKGARRRRAA